MIPAGHTPELEGKVMLNVHKLVNEPNQWGGRGVIVRHPEHDGLLFDSSDEAKAYKIEHGLVKPFVESEALKAMKARGQR